MKTLTAEHADRLLRRCLFPQNSPWFPVDDELDERLRPIASGAHEVIDLATTRCVSVETLRRIQRGTRHDYDERGTDCPVKRLIDNYHGIELAMMSAQCTCGLTAALAGIEEKLRDA